MVRRCAARPLRIGRASIGRPETTEHGHTGPPQPQQRGRDSRFGDRRPDRSGTGKLENEKNGKATRDRGEGHSGERAGGTIEPPEWRRAQRVRPCLRGERQQRRERQSAEHRHHPFQRPEENFGTGVRPTDAHPVQNDDGQPDACKNPDGAEDLHQQASSETVDRREQNQDHENPVHPVEPECVQFG